MAITRKEVEHVARLARLSLSDAETETFTVQMGSILTYIDKLNALPTEGIAPASHAFPVANVMRPDAPERQTLSSREDLLANAPEREGPFVKVKKVIE